MGFSVPDAAQGLPPGHAKGEHVDPVGVSYDGGRRRSSGYEEATKGWAADGTTSGAGLGDKGQMAESKADELKAPDDDDDPPPAYTRYAVEDIPAAPTNKPEVVSPSFDIPAAPG